MNDIMSCPSLDESRAAVPLCVLQAARPSTRATTHKVSAFQVLDLPLPNTLRRQLDERRAVGGLCREQHLGQLVGRDGAVVDAGLRQLAVRRQLQYG